VLTACAEGARDGVDAAGSVPAWTCAEWQAACGRRIRDWTWFDGARIDEASSGMIAPLRLQLRARERGELFADVRDVGLDLPRFGEALERKVARGVFGCSDPRGPPCATYLIAIGSSALLRIIPSLFTARLHWRGLVGIRRGSGRSSVEHFEMWSHPVAEAKCDFGHRERWSLRYAKADSRRADSVSPLYFNLLPKGAPERARGGGEAARVRSMAARRCAILG